MNNMLLMAIIAAAGMLFLAFKFGPFHRILTYDLWIDLIATIVLCTMMQGTFSGIITALIAGTLISIVLTTLKQLFGYEQLTRYGWQRIPGLIKKWKQS